MKERPILFSSDMVKAILDGRKTQTRRVLKEPDSWIACLTGDCPHEKQAECDAWIASFCPYGIAGDRLFVKENAFIAPKNFGDKDLTNCTDKDGDRRMVGYTASMSGDAQDCARDYKLKISPSIFMPRWASRITLEIVSVRVERLQDISENDCYEEGIPRPKERLGSEVCARDNARSAYQSLWDSINRKSHPWGSNPWVWRIEFKRV